MDTKKLSRRDFLRMSTLVAAGAALASCGPTPTPEVVHEEVEVTRMVAGTPETVVITATPPPAEPVPVHYTVEALGPEVEQILRPLVEEHLGNAIDFTVDATPLSDDWAIYMDKVITRIAGGEVLDIIHFATEGIGLFAEKKIFQPIDSWFDADDAFKADVEQDIHPTLMNAHRWKGKLMGLPSDWNNMVIYYNYKIFADRGVPEPTADWTWDDFVEVCSKIAHVTGSAEDLYAYVFSTSMFGLDPWFYNNDTSIFTDDLMGSNMDDPKVAETLQFLADLVLTHRVSPNPTGWDASGNMYASHLAMRSCGRWCILGCTNNSFFDYKLQYQPHKQGPLKTVVGVGGDAMATMARHPDMCWEVIKIICSTEYQQQYIKIMGANMSRRSASLDYAYYMDSAKPSPADMHIFYDSLDYAKPVEAPPNYNIVVPMLDRWFSQIWNGELSTDEAVAGAHEELQAEMDKLREE
jgi:multiple sugar transport system substrate-binding protein